MTMTPMTHDRHVGSWPCEPIWSRVLNCGWLPLADAAGTVSRTTRTTSASHDCHVRSNLEDSRQSVVVEQWNMNSKAETATDNNVGFTVGLSEL